MDIEALQRLYQASRPTSARYVRRIRPESAPVSTWEDTSENCEHLSVDFREFFDKTIPRIPPAIARMPENQFLPTLLSLDVAAQAPVPGPMKRIVPEAAVPKKKKAYHPNRGETECVTAESRHRIAWERLKAEKQLREDKDKLRRYNAECVRRANERFAELERENLDRYKLKMLDHKPIVLSPKQLKGLGSMQNKIPKDLIDDPTSPYTPRRKPEVQSPPSKKQQRKPPVPRRPCKQTNDDSQKETQRRKSDVAKHVRKKSVTPSPTPAPTPVEEEINDDEMELRIKWPNGVWMSVAGRTSSTVEELKGALSLLTMEDQKEPLLACEFQLREFTEAPTPAPLDDHAVLASTTKARSFAVELSDLGSELHAAMAKVHDPTVFIEKTKKKSKKLGSFRLLQVMNTPSTKEEHVVIDVTRPIHTPAEWAKMTEELRGASRTIKGERNWAKSKAECSRHHRKLIEIEKSLEERMTERRDPPISGGGDIVMDDDQRARQQMFDDVCMMGEYLGRPTLETIFTDTGPDLKKLQSAFVAVPRRPRSRTTPLFREMERNKARSRMKQLRQQHAINLFTDDEITAIHVS